MGGFILKFSRYFIGISFFLIGNFFFCLIALFLFKNPINNYIYGRVIAFLCKKIYNFKVIVDGQNHLNHNNPSVYIANHQTNFDLMIYGVAFPINTVTIGKTSLMLIPFFGFFYYLAGNIFINRNKHSKAMNAMKDVEKKLIKGISLWVFPEGTRNYNGGLKPFKKGPFYSAIKCQAFIQPFIASNFRKSLDFSRWNSGTILIKILEPISTIGKNVENDLENMIEHTYQRMNTEIIALDKKAEEAGYYNIQFIESTVISAALK